MSDSTDFIHRDGTLEGIDLGNVAEKKATTLTSIIELSVEADSIAGFGGWEGHVKFKKTSAIKVVFANLFFVDISPRDTMTQEGALGACLTNSGGKGIEERDNRHPDVQIQDQHRLRL